MQLCKLWNIRTVNVVRNRDNLNALVCELKEIGADEVFTEEEMKEESKNKVSLFHLILATMNGISIGIQNHVYDNIS